MLESSFAMAASKLNDSPGKNISIKDYFIIMVHFFETILQIHLVTRRLCEFSPRVYVCFLFAIQSQLVTQPKIHVSAAYCTLCALYVTFGLQLSQSFQYINIKIGEALYGLGYSKEQP